MTYKQLPLTGDTNDHAHSEDLLWGIQDLMNALDYFYEVNKEYNPRQLHYLVTQYSNVKHLDALVNCDS